MAHRNYAKSIDLPKEQMFRNLKNAKRFAIDIGKFMYIFVFLLKKKVAC